MKDTIGPARSIFPDDRHARPDAPPEPSHPRQRLTTGACMRVLLAFSSAAGDHADPEEGLTATRPRSPNRCDSADDRD